MNIVIVYDSVFGNTEQIARAMGKALQDKHNVQVVRPSEMDPATLTSDLLIVGSPTRKFSPTPDIRKFIKRLNRKKIKGQGVAAFDTRISEQDTESAVLKFFIKMFGYAAEPMNKQLVKKEGIQKGAPAGFIVQDVKGPLKEGELQRAAEWAKHLV